MNDYIGGYYSIIRYVPDTVRGEGANIGVVLLCPETGFLDVQISKGNDRVRRFFKKEPKLDLGQLNNLKEEFVGRILAAQSDIATLDDLKKFISTRANCFQMTEPRFLKTDNPESEVKLLFDRMVGCE